MGLFELFFPQIAGAEHLKNISRQMAIQNYKSKPTTGAGSKRLQELEEDLGFISLILMSTLRVLEDNDLLNANEIFEKMRQIDVMDGVEDGKLNLDAVRTVFGLARKKESAVKPPKKKPKR